MWQSPSCLSPVPSRWSRLCVLGMALVCVSLPRFWNLGHPSFTYDELADYSDSFRFVARPAVGAPISEGYLNGQLPFFTAWGLYKVLGCNETTARLQSALVSLLSVFLVFLIVARLSGFWYGVLALLLLGLSPFYLSASRLAFTHGHVFCTVPLLAALYFLQRLHGNVTSHRVSRRNRWLAAAVGLCLGLAIGSDLLAGFWAVSVVLWLRVWIARPAARIDINHIEVFLAGCLLGTFVASPMYAVGFPSCLSDTIPRLRSPDALGTYLWLGRVVERIPFYYYALVLVTKLTPVVLILGLVTLVLYVWTPSAGHPFCRLLIVCLWPILYLALRPWKNPYYLTPFIPPLYILLTDGLRALFGTPVFRRRRSLCLLVVLSLLADQVYALVRLHPDYLMQGIEYSGRLYGEFQGPAVSHGQWIGEALGFIKQDCQGRDGIVYAVCNVGTPQIHHYARQYGIPVRIGKVPPSGIGDNPVDRHSVYILITRDAKQMICPAHKDAIRDNSALVSFVESSTEYTLVKTYCSGHFPMVWIYRESPPVHRPLPARSYDPSRSR